MVESSVSLPTKWEQFLKHLADDHEIDLNVVVSELCDWAFSDAESARFLTDLPSSLERDTRDFGSSWAFLS